MQLIFAALLVAATTMAQETPFAASVPNGGPVCGPLIEPVECRTWVKFPTATTAVQFVGRCRTQSQPLWHPEGSWDRQCSEVAGPGQACIAQAYYVGPRS